MGPRVVVWMATVVQVALQPATVHRVALPPVALVIYLSSQRGTSCLFNPLSGIGADVVELGEVAVLLAGVLAPVDSRGVAGIGAGDGAHCFKAHKEIQQGELFTCQLPD